MNSGHEVQTNTMCKTNVYGQDKPNRNPNGQTETDRQIGRGCAIRGTVNKPRHAKSNSFLYLGLS